MGALSAPQAASPATDGFYPRVESLRGLAALMVAVFHSIHLLPVDGIDQVYLRTFRDIEGAQALATRLLMIVFNGGAAVSLFFVISGFVLSLSLMRDPRGSLAVAAAFPLRRFFRIYPALAVNLLVFWAALWAAAGLLPGLFDPPAADALVINLALVDVSINGATWSLAVELLVVPFILAAGLAMRRIGRWTILAIAGLATAALFSPRLLFRVPYLHTYMFMFMWGMAIPVIAPLVRRYLPDAGAAALLALGAALALMARFIIAYWSSWTFFVEALGCALLVSLAAYGPNLRAMRLLDAPAVRFLGRVSYSFYLYHPLFLMLGAKLLFAALGTTGALERASLAVGLLIAVVTVPLSIAAAEVSYRAIERPAIGIGRRVEAAVLSLLRLRTRARMPAVPS